ncbi:MAG: PRD domain-containing protein [Alkalibacterium sp.]|nr:PRD domain-containing protein [Alkalibacterium sp.]
MIKEKLRILKESNVIDEAAFTYSEEALMFLKKKEVIEDDDEADVFITHLAMATARQESDEKIEPLNTSIKEEIKQSDKYNEATTIWDELKQLAPADFNPDEDGYFHLHLVTLLQNNR